MDRAFSRFARAIGGLPALFLFLLCPASAFAHKLNVFAERIAGATIHGYAYFPGDIAAQRIEVIVRDRSGRELGRTTTDDKGKFTFVAREHVDHYLVAETPDGHSGQYIVHASALPENLPGSGPAADGASHVASPATDQAGVLATMEGKDNEPGSVTDQLRALSKQLDELSRQIHDSEEHLRFRDILGGIGFILGLAGVSFYMKARRSKT